MCNCDIGIDCSENQQQQPDEAVSKAVAARFDVDVVGKTGCQAVRSKSQCGTSYTDNCLHCDPSKQYDCTECCPGCKQATKGPNTYVAATTVPFWLGLDLSPGGSTPRCRHRCTCCGDSRPRPSLVPKAGPPALVPHCLSSDICFTGTASAAPRMRASTPPTRRPTSSRTSRLRAARPALCSRPSTDGTMGMARAPAPSSAPGSSRTVRTSFVPLCCLLVFVLL